MRRSACSRRCILSTRRLLALLDIIAHRQAGPPPYRYLQSSSAPRLRAAAVSLGSAEAQRHAHHERAWGRRTTAAPLPSTYSTTTYHSQPCRLDSTIVAETSRHYISHRTTFALVQPHALFPLAQVTDRHHDFSPWQPHRLSRARGGL